MRKANAALYLVKRDPILGRLIHRLDLPRLKPCRNRFQFLAEAIIGQQLSDAAARTITRRFRSLFYGKAFPSPHAMLEMPLSRMRTAGISGAKASYLHHASRAVESGALDFRTLGKLSDQEVAARLTAVKGIGPWTAEMFLIFALGRPDVFSPGDAGLQCAMRRVYGLTKPPSAAWLRRTTDRWRPYRSLACRYLWASLDLEE